MPGVFYNDQNRNLKPKRDIFQDGSVPKHNQSFSASHDELKNVTLIDIKFQKNIHHGYWVAKLSIFLYFNVNQNKYVQLSS